MRWKLRRHFLIYLRQDKPRGAFAGARFGDSRPQILQFIAKRLILLWLIEPTNNLSGDRLGLTSIRQKLRKKLLFRQHIHQADVRRGLEKPGDLEIDSPDPVEHDRWPDAVQQLQSDRPGDGDARPGQFD